VRIEPLTALNPPESRDSAATAIWRGVLFLVFALLIFWQASMALKLAARDKPYEGWDEIATYNNARVVSGPHVAFSLRYGSLETFLQILATQYFLLFDPVGPGEDHYAVSNNYLSSFTDRHVEFGGMAATFSYAYFRGLDDHQPIFLSRQIHVVVTYGLALLIGTLAFYYLGLDALLLLLPLCCLTVNTEIAAQASAALPNALNAVIAFSVTLLGFLAAAERRESCLYIGAALAAIAVNMKIDAILLGGVLGLAIFVSGWRAGISGLGRQILMSAGIFALVYTVTNPGVLTDPDSVLTQITSTSLDAGHTPLGSIATAYQNLGVLRLFVESNLVPWGTGNTPAGVMSIGLIALALAALAIVLWRRRADLAALAIPAAALLLLWLYPMLTISIFYPRYYLNGLGALYALIGAALVMVWRLRIPAGRGCVLTILVLLLVQYGALVSAYRAAALQTEAKAFYVGVGDRRDGFARGFTRTEIERRAIEAWQSGNYDRTILVDQHGYFDLRMLRLAGMRPVYVNLFNDEEVLRGLDQSVDHLLLFSPGSYATDSSWWRPWMTRWTPETARRYDTYRARLDAFPVCEEIAGPPQRLLWTGPVAPDDHMVLAVIPKADLTPT
jgi:hypothetical protein